MSASVCKSMLKSKMLLKFIKITSKGRSGKNIKKFQGSGFKLKKFGIFLGENYILYVSLWESSSV